MKTLPLLPPPTPSENDDGEGKMQQSFKLVPWISWDEWTFIHDSLFSPSSSSVSSALQRIVTWRTRGCIPVAVDVTASIIEIQQKDPFFRRNELVESAVQSEEILAMLYCMAIMRLVNGVVEKTRKKHEVSIAEAAYGIGLPRMLIDVRHEGSHRDLPSLQLVRLASTKALDWLKSYYWEPQRSAIPIQGDATTKLRREIKQRLLELAFCLKAKENAQSSPTLVKGKRIKHLELLGAHNKFLSFMAAKHPHTKASGSKKYLRKKIKNVLLLYSSYSSEVVCIILEILLKALDSSDVMEVMDGSECQANDMHAIFDDWKAVIVKLSNKKPEFLLTFLRAVLQKFEIHENDKQERGEQLSLQNLSESHETVQLSRLLECLVDILGMLKHVRRKKLAVETEDPCSSIIPNATLSELLHKCLLACSHGENQLIASALVIARMMGNSNLTHKLNKLSMLNVKEPDARFVLAPHTDSQSFFTQQEESICQAAMKLDLIKLTWLRSNKAEPRDNRVELKSRWTVAKSWNPCPIGMLPHTLGSSGDLPMLDFNDENEVPETTTSEEQLEQNQSCGKRAADRPTENLDDSSVKRIRETLGSSESYDKDNITTEGVKGLLMIDGGWRKVRQEEVIAISSAVRILV